MLIKKLTTNSSYSTLLVLTAQNKQRNLLGISSGAILKIGMITLQIGHLTFGVQVSSLLEENK
jgi:hypothetical protein